MSLLTPSEPPPVKLIQAAGVGSQSIVLCCDHASNRVPVSLNQLGLGTQALSRHSAIDIGARALTEELASRLNSPAVIAEYSRLVVDLNRYPQHFGFIPAQADGESVSGNQQISVAQKRSRQVTFFDPYHEALAGQLRRQEQVHSHSLLTPCSLICVHSFTPSLKSGDTAQRPWDIGILWVDDDRLSQVMLEQLRRYTDLCVGVNEPYNGKQPLGFTPHFHAELMQRPYLLIEVRQDLIDHPAGVLRWADMLQDCLTASLAAYHGD